MENYRTVKDKAAEWNLSPRHVQYLCRTGKIEHAIKRADVWFIPVDAPSPAIKTKQGGKDFSFVGTKKKIFDNAIELFMLRGFDSVSLRDIADKVGIRQSTIYNHFKSKQGILDTIYAFYRHYFLEDRPSLKDMEAKLHSDGLPDIINAIKYEFKTEYIQEISDITKIIFQRISVDDRAREIAKSLILDEGTKYVEAVFGMGIENGRFAPFDPHAAAVFINSVRIFTMFNWIVDPSPSSMTKILEDEQTMYKYAAKLIDDLGAD